MAKGRLLGSVFKYIGPLPPLKMAHFPWVSLLNQGEAETLRNTLTLCCCQVSTTNAASGAPPWTVHLTYHAAHVAVARHGDVFVDGDKDVLRSLRSCREAWVRLTLDLRPRDSVGLVVALSSK